MPRWRAFPRYDSTGQGIDARPDCRGPRCYPLCGEVRSANGSEAVYSRAACVRIRKLAPHLLDVADHESDLMQRARVDFGADEATDEKLRLEVRLAGGRQVLWMDRAGRGIFRLCIAPGP